MTNEQITELLDSYITGVVSVSEGEVPQGARFFDWETEGDVRNSLREIRDELIRLNSN